MEGDYNRISSRYVKLFADLDNECYKRIYALDKQSFSLSEKVLKELLCESTGDTAAMNLLGIDEVSSSKTLVFVSSLNRKVLDVLKTLHDYITQETRINALVNSFLFNEDIGENIPLNIPVLWSESDQTEGNTTGVNRECFVPEYVDPQGRQAIMEKVNAFCSGSSPSVWENPEKTEKESINKEFNTLAEKHYANAGGAYAEGGEEQRVYKTLMSLWQNTQQLSLKSKE
jgi:hypothetical protein